MKQILYYFLVVSAFGNLAFADSSKPMGQYFDFYKSSASKGLWSHKCAYVNGLRIVDEIAFSSFGSVSNKPNLVLSFVKEVGYRPTKITIKYGSGAKKNVIESVSIQLLSLVNYGTHSQYRGGRYLGKCTNNPY